MKIFSVVCVGMALTSLPALCATPAWQTVFSVPPYQLDETVVDREGWKKVSSGNPDKALVRPNPGDASKTGLQLQMYGIQHDFDERLVGSVNITAVVAFGQIPLRGSTGTLTFMPVFNKGHLGYAPFGYSDKEATDDMEGGGIFYEFSEINDEGVQKSKRIILVPRADINPETKYTLSMNLNLDAQVYEISVTSADNSFQAKSGEIMMTNGDRRFAMFLDGIRIASSLINTELYIESLTFSVND